MPTDPAWDAWFELQYDILRRLREEIDGQTRGKSDAFKAAIYAGLIEGLAEDMRQVLHLPHTDAEPAGTDVCLEVIEAEADARLRTWTRPAGSPSATAAGNPTSRSRPARQPKPSGKPTGSCRRSGTVSASQPIRPRSASYGRPS
jgi:hypothetical protein